MSANRASRTMDIDSMRLRGKDLDSLTRHRRLSLRDLLNVFTPTSAIADPVKFAGRKEQVEQVTTALLSPDADLVIFGERGAGKTSLAHMMHAIATGHYQLLDYYGLRQHLERKGFFPFTKERKTFTVIWVDGFAKTVDQVIHAVLTRKPDGRCGPGLLAYLPSEASQIEVASKIGFNKVFTGESTLKEIFVPEQPINVKEGFELATQRFAEANPGQEVLIIVDEFETIQNRAEMSQYLKTSAARFALVGIAATTLDLLGEHASVARATYGITLPPMSSRELAEILQIGCRILAQFFDYADDAIEDIAHLSHGSPYWCHFLARAVLQDRMESMGGWNEFLGSRLPVPIRHWDVRQALSTLPERPDCHLYEEALLQAAMGDRTNMQVLRTIAAQPQSMISSSEVCGSLVNQGIDAATGRETVEGLLSLPGIFEEHGRIRSIIQFSFRDPNFRRYILLRSGGDFDAFDTGAAGDRPQPRVLLPRRSQGPLTARPDLRPGHEGLQNEKPDKSLTS